MSNKRDNINLCLILNIRPPTTMLTPTLQEILYFNLLIFEESDSILFEIFCRS